MKKVLLFIFCIHSINYAQSKRDIALKPADTFSINRRNIVVISQATIATTTLVGLNQLWYKEYPKSNFHTINDNSEWLQMDKAGHVFSAYHLGKIGAETLSWAGVSKKNQLVYGATLGFVFLSSVEVFDGFSSQWGFSYGDMIANASGTGLYISQELLWKEQRIIPKFSFHTTSYATARPEVLGNSFSQQILKDYNGQTYWLSGNIRSFFKQSKIPQWLNVAIGYGGQGMVYGNNYNFDGRTRQYYLSLDINLVKIPTKSNILKTVFEVCNTLKIPAPTIEINDLQRIKLHAFYF